MRNKLSIIMPVYNEISTLDKIISKVKSSILVDVEKEIIIVDDGSKDGSREFLSKIKDPNINIVFNKNNLGKGGAVKAGIKVATGNILITQDADLEYDPNDYMSVIKPILEGKSKAVLGIRNSLKNNIWSRGLLHKMGNAVITLVTNILYLNNSKEYTGCYKAFSKDLIDSIYVKSNNFAYEHELVCKVLKKGFKTVDVPISYYPRDHKQGKKINWKDGFKILWAVIKYRFVD